MAEDAVAWVDADSEDDLRLMADAPEMLDLLEELADHEHRWSCNDEWCQKLLPKLFALVRRHGRGL